MSRRDHGGDADAWGEPAVSDTVTSSRDNLDTLNTLFPVAERGLGARLGQFARRAADAPRRSDRPRPTPYGAPHAWHAPATFTFPARALAIGLLTGSLLVWARITVQEHVRAAFHAPVWLVLTAGAAVFVLVALTGSRHPAPAVLALALAAVAAISCAEYVGYVAPPLLAGAAVVRAAWAASRARGRRDHH